MIYVGITVYSWLLGRMHRILAGTIATIVALYVGMVVYETQRATAIAMLKNYDQRDRGDF